MKTVLRLAQNKKASRVVFWVLAILTMARDFIIPSTVSDQTRTLIQYSLLGVVLIWAAIYNFAPKQETMEELRKRHRGTVWVILIAIIVFMAVQLYDRFYFLPKVKALKESMVPKNK